MVQLILGNITFDNFSDEEMARFITQADRKAVVHEITGIIECETKEQAEEIGELHVNEFHSYIIPEVFQSELSGEIYYECSKALSVPLTPREEQEEKLDNYVIEYTNEDGKDITISMQRDELIKAWEQEKKENKIVSQRADYVPLVQMVEAMELAYSVVELLEVIGYPISK